jgi:hypothetical protein
MIEEISGRIHDMNLLTDSGTVLDFTPLHAILTNPNYPEMVLPLDTFESRHYDNENYEAILRSLIAEIGGYNIELVAVVCDNCPAQVNGVAQALAFFSRSRHPAYSMPKSHDQSRFYARPS